MSYDSSFAGGDKPSREQSCHIGILIGYKTKMTPYTFHSRTKSPQLSKTIGTNSVTGLLGLVAMFFGSGVVQAHPALAVWSTVVLPVANFLLRYVTKKPVAIPGTIGEFVRQDVPKDFWKSTAFWMNAAFLALGLTGTLLPLSAVQAVPIVASSLIAIQSGANILVRFFKTSGPIKSVGESMGI